jgi:hypothetical protein
MLESGWYPTGAQFDSSAPYNQVEVPKVKCEVCDGEGYIYYSYNIETDQLKEISKEEWERLPTEEVAMAEGIFLCQSKPEMCDNCDGTGEVDDEYDDMYYEEER